MVCGQFIARTCRLEFGVLSRCTSCRSLPDSMADMAALSTSCSVSSVAFRGEDSMSRAREDRIGFRGCKVIMSENK